MYANREKKLKIIKLVLTISINLGLILCCVFIPLCAFWRKKDFMSYFFSMGLLLISIYAFYEYIERNW
ncbi:hypothetical protein WY13_02604 [Clostridium ljungdahlii]|uniref:Uncharacterized protein n=1 Tax=Clostridium ljungdahlii TaxID=1538 RepID=A0A168MHP3_9CLOT|nr:hypothetical protein WY13_02604 [Clostridium ljungdahlii]